MERGSAGQGGREGFRAPPMPPCPPISPANGRGIPPDPPCTERGTSPCFSTDRSRIGHALCLPWGPQPIGCCIGYALRPAPAPRHVPQQSFPAAAAPCHHSRDKPAPKRRGRDQLRQAAFSPKANTRVAKRLGRVAKHANKKDEVRNHKGVSKPRLFA